MHDTYDITILGIYVADTAYKAARLPKIGETLMGSGFGLGPGGKGSNQAVACAQAGANTAFISKIGNDPFGKMALDMYAKSGVQPLLEVSDALPTGAAFIFVDDSTGDNAIIVCPEVANTLDKPFVDRQKQVIENAKIFITQLEQPADVALHALHIAKSAGVRTLFNPAPMVDFDDAVYELCDYIIPNETETEALVGFPITNANDAEKGAKILHARGVKNVLITLGENGVFVYNDTLNTHIAAIATTVVDTTGAGDAFIGGFATALAAGRETIAAVQFGCATASLAVSRVGTAAAMPSRQEIDVLLQRTYPHV